MTDPPWEPPLAGTDVEHAVGTLERLRATFRWKADGLDVDQLRSRPFPSSELSVGGLLKHLAVVEASWVNLTFAGGVEPPSWTGQQQVEGEGWTFRTAAADSPEQLFAWLEEAQRVTERVVAGAATLDVLAHEEPWGEPCSLRWVLLHLVQEYARHLGHADLIREAVDGTVGI